MATKAAVKKGTAGVEGAGPAAQPSADQSAASGAAAGGPAPMSITLGAANAAAQGTNPRPARSSGGASGAGDVNMTGSGDPLSTAAERDGPRQSIGANQS